MLRRVIYIAFLICFGAAGGVLSQSQIIDDSTTQVYGPYTTFFQTYEDIKYNRDNLRNIDSTITNLHRFNVQERTGYTIQGLGNLGTATHPLFYTMPEEVGATTGFRAYDPFIITKKDVPYYDTRSPYTYLNVILGGKGRAMTSVKHTRNITPYWNAGFGYDRISAEKQVASSGRGDRQTLSNAYYFHTHYMSPNAKYTGLASITRINHKVEESGGIVIPEGGTVEDYFDDNADVRLQTASSNAYRIGFHVYNEYKFAKQLQVYYDFEQAVSKNFYRDSDPDPEYYDQILISTDSTADKAQFNQLTNEMGVKGDLADMYFNFYVKFRNLKYIEQYLPENERINENSGGFNLRYDFDSLQYIHASGEYMLGGYYRFGGTYVMKFLTVDYWRTRYKPSIIENTYFGNHHEWYNNFTPTSADLLKASVIGNFKLLKIAPSISLVNVKDRVYYGYDKNPAQAGGSTRLLSPGLQLDFTFFKKFHFNNEIIYTLISGDSVASNTFRIPKWFINSSLFYGSHFFGGKIYVQAGVDLHYKTDFVGLAYNPVVQQFYLQDDFLIPAYPIASIFIDFQIDHVSVFLKMPQVNQGNLSGYFTYPYYTGQKRTLDIGVRWLFFN